MVDEDGIVRHVLHTEQPWRPPTEARSIHSRRPSSTCAPSPGCWARDAALESVDERVNYAEPRPDQDSFRLVDEKQQFDSATFAFAQTYLYVPVWRRGISVTVKRDSSGVVESTNTTLPGVEVGTPSGEAIDRWRESPAARAKPARRPRGRPATGWSPTRSASARGGGGGGVRHRLPMRLSCT